MDGAYLTLAVLAMVVWTTLAVAAAVVYLPV